MDHNEDLTVDEICNENAMRSCETTKEEDEEEDNATDETSEMIPTTMLTPPPTGEPLLNGSSRSSTSGNDLQQDFTVDELSQPSPVLSQHTDEGNSNQSANSDSVDTKLIINEGSIDSSDTSNTVDDKMLKTPIDVQSTIVPTVETNQIDDTFDVENQISNQVILSPESSSTEDVKENESLPTCNNTDVILQPERLEHDNAAVGADNEGILFEKEKKIYVQ